MHRTLKESNHGGKKPKIRKKSGKTRNRKSTIDQVTAPMATVILSIRYSISKQN